MPGGKPGALGSASCRRSSPSGLPRSRLPRRPPLQDRRRTFTMDTRGSAEALRSRPTPWQSSVGAVTVSQENESLFM
ncbi:hypothetical protein AGIG_G18722 [Arapaima gigas]